ncbi:MULTISPECIES: histidine phosphatase family protein [Bacillaceae]|uniref:Phosphoglycerate mutase family protein n=1 Tax=Evansella alkalicola TaxID=745819 RepID=A0ABS6JXI1_9BACI|nr:MULTISPECIES: histidine phosphatase family protein [Bacillaceae]MBU9723213.1 phosphoglycerate mutase family protein [Bacillus alkalicola]
MKIGLVRHFEVQLGYPKGRVNAEGLRNWASEYDVSEVITRDVQISDGEWGNCFSSDLYRAQVTAESIYQREITYLEDLREIPVAPCLPSKWKLPLSFHLVAGRIAWYVNHKSQPETRTSVIKRLNQFLDRVIENGDNTLVVSHGGIIIFLRRELLRRGFKGPKISRPENGKLYVFERQK